jgi:hypothetical protein
MQNKIIKIPKFVKNLFSPDIREWLREWETVFRDFIRLETGRERHPASRQQKAMIDELRNDLNTKKSVVSGKRWKRFAAKLRLYIRWFDPRNFLEWGVITSTMFLKNAQKDCLAEMQKSAAWPVWETAIKEDEFGKPAIDPAAKTSGTLVAHAYHLYRMRESTEIDYKNLETIVEFGGGYGSMCRLVRKLGFVGNYIIYDLPEFSALQKFYLRGIGSDAADMKNFSGIRGGNILLSDEEDVKKVLAAESDGKKLFIATWSISESPVEQREIFFEIINGFDYFLFGYQDKFDGIDNIGYFKDLRNRRADIIWSNIDISDKWNKSFYLFGKK